MAKRHHWMTTGPDPKRWGDIDSGQRGWCLHAVPGEDSDTGDDVRYTGSLCGVFPSYGWGLDMFIERPCFRCVSAALAQGITLPSDIAKTVRAFAYGTDRDQKRWARVLAVLNTTKES